MEKTSVYLTDRERHHLEELRRRTGRSQSELIREAINAYQDGSRVPDRHFAIIGAATVPGFSVADVPDEQLFRGFGE